jgi:hypothetical protein
MKRLFLMCLLVPAAAFCAGVFDGTWKTKADSFQVTGKPDDYVLANGMYRCNSCVPPIAVKADGTDQSVTGHDYYDSIAVKIVSATAVGFTRKKGGKVMNTDAASVSADGKTLTDKWVDYQGAQPAKGTSTSTRLTAGPAGSHALSGTWQQSKFSDGSDSLLTVKFTSSADGLKMEWNGQNYDAKFDGKEYPIKNDPGGTTVSLKRIDAHTLEETDRRQGKVTDVIRTTAAADGKTLSVVDDSPLYGTKATYTMTKQP